MRRPSSGWSLGASVAMALVAIAFGVDAQLGVRPTDPLGLSLRFERIRIPHGERPGEPGTTLHLERWDPWLAYSLGYSYFQREWTVEEGLFTALNKRPDAGATNSCAMCHNLPFRSAGSGGNVADPGGFGRNVPHLFGVGLIETLGLQIRQQILRKQDRNGNGFLDWDSETRGKRAVVEAAPGVAVDFGSLDDLNGDGLPGLNDVVRVVLVDRTGRPVKRTEGPPPRLGDPDVAGYDLYLAPLGAAVGDHQLPTLRSFVIGVMNTVMGIPAVDPTIGEDSGTDGDEVAGDGWSKTSIAGAPQRHFPLAKEAELKGPALREGELDLIEWFLLNHPAPAVGKQSRQTRRGRELLRKLGCTDCHVERWRIQPADTGRGFPGDRRFFDMRVRFDAAQNRLVGQVRPLVRETAGPDGEPLKVPLRGGYTVEGLYSDLKHHDLGDRFTQYFSRDGILYGVRRFRTTPLWGVGSTAPYGHDGRSPTLDDVIRRHGGEARESAERYRRSAPEQRRAVVAFLKSLVLFSPDTLPADIDGDGRIESDYRVAGQPVGPERLHPEFLYRTPPRYRGWVEQDGERFLSLEVLNLDDLLAAILGRDTTKSQPYAGPGGPTDPRTGAAGLRSNYR